MILKLVLKRFFSISARRPLMEESLIQLTFGGETGSYGLKKIAQKKRKKRAQAYAYWHVLGTLEASLDLLGGSWQPQPHFQRVLTAGPDRKRLSSWEI